MKNGACVVFVLILALLVTPVGAATIWDVEYFPQGDITHFYGPGTYDLLLGPGYITVYLMTGPPNWTVFIGMYGAPALGYPEAPLPDGFPMIAFPPGTDQAVAVPVFVDVLTIGPVASVPEASSGLLLVAAQAALLAMRVGRLLE
jgi:hypothetical protein